MGGDIPFVINAEDSPPPSQSPLDCPGLPAGRWNQNARTKSSISLGSMLLRPATPEDLAGILALESSAQARPFVGQWDVQRHLSVLRGGDARYFVSATVPGELEAYAILRGVREDSGAIELKRIVVARPGRGLGRRVLEELMRIAFDDLGAHRFFLDVYEDNVRARHLYESLGFVYEGILRDGARRRDGGYCDLRLMAMLESEYRSRQV